MTTPNKMTTLNKLIDPKQASQLAKEHLITGLDAICVSLEPTDAQYEKAQKHYETIGQFLQDENGEESLSKYKPSVYPQGSMRIRTAIRPNNGNEFDVDVVCEFQEQPHHEPKEVKKLLHKRLSSHATYKEMTEEKNRCLRLNYAGEFHMDIMPCVPETAYGHVRVPDKKLNAWKPSHPKGFAAFVDKAAAQTPKLQRLHEGKMVYEPLPPQQSFTKPPLLRIIQLLKRHRDEHFKNKQDASPISVVITTLATHAYNKQVHSQYYDSVFDLLCAVINDMPSHIEQRNNQWWVANPAHPSENFAERWNQEPNLKQAFDAWHLRLKKEMQLLLNPLNEGIDGLGKELNCFGEASSKTATTRISESIGAASKSGTSAIMSPSFVVDAKNGYPSITKNPPHTNFGA